jgi:hypothetical protein
MTAAARIVLSIILTTVTGGAGGALSGLGSATASTIGGMAGAVVGGVVNLAVNTFVNSFAINAIDKRGNLGNATKATFNKQAVKGFCKELMVKALIGDGPGDIGGVENATTWIGQFQGMLVNNLGSTMASFVSQGLIDKNWDFKGAATNWVADTAAQFGAAKIGGWRAGTLTNKQGNILNFLGHKAMHGALAAAKAAAVAKIGQFKGKEFRKTVLGATAGAMMAESMTELLMFASQGRIETELKEAGHTQGTTAYETLHQERMQEAFKEAQMYARMAVAVTAQALDVDINAAMSAAENALLHNSSQVFEAMLHSNNPDDLFAAMVEDQLGEEEDEGIEEEVLDDKAYFSEGDEKNTPFNKSIKGIEKKGGQGIEALDKTSYGKKLITLGRSAKAHLRKMAEQQAPYNAPYPEYEQCQIVQFEQEREGIQFNSLSKAEQASLRNEWVEEYCALSSHGFFSGVGQLIDDGCKYGGHKVGKGLARQMRDLGFEKATAQDTGRGVETLLGVAGMVFNPLGKLGAAGKVEKMVGVAKNSNRATKASRTLEGLDLVSVSKATPIHKNSLSYLGETHLYVIRDSSGKILKYGESAAGKNKLGQSKRAEAQIVKLKKQNSGEKYISHIVKEFNSKAEVRKSEAKYIKTHRTVFGKDSLPLNKNNR